MSGMEAVNPDRPLVFVGKQRVGHRGRMVDGALQTVCGIVGAKVHQPSDDELARAFSFVPSTDKGLVSCYRCI